MQALVKEAITIKIVKYESPIILAISDASAEKPEHVGPRILTAGNSKQVYDVLAALLKTSPIMHQWLTRPFTLSM
ncbi:hypothetical protein N7471_011929 [Penicillium samsonianum]|uniref:uncharacterized protein n=1 Tax=Penicillium samsonianum TaxID=1882272 RepID=UPI00254678A4|nr:uncharacterized protein N7471_011929 [Penicillium samsonianum]KAJ6124612.1 hypothetical protein N7471_011929 [Penicillium samsonianum]